MPKFTVSTSSRYYEPTGIAHPNHIDREIWSTWFLPECEESRLFGVNAPFLLHLQSYTIGRKFYLEDRPYFASDKSEHRICGPYVVVFATVPSDCRHICHRDRRTQAPIVYQDRDPSRGPWLRQARVIRVINGEEVTFPQLADRFNYFPFRFCMKRADDWVEEYHKHGIRCPWCEFD